MFAKELHGCHINYDETVKGALIHLENHLDEKECHTLLEHAKDHQESYFQDRNLHHFILEYKDREYFLLKR